MQSTLMFRVICNKKAMLATKRAIQKNVEKELAEDASLRRKVAGWIAEMSVKTAPYVYGNLRRRSWGYRKGANIHRKMSTYE
jgi:hypothetical protein